MPKDDEIFSSDASSAYTAMRQAMYYAILSGSLPKEFVDPFMSDLAVYTTYFTHIGSISGGTQPVFEDITMRILPELEKFDITSNEGPIFTIRGKLEEWDGPSGSASYEFKWNYLPALANSLENSYSAFQALAAAIAILEGIIDQARQKYLDLMSNVVTAIDASVEQASRDSSAASTVVAVGSAIGTGFSVGTVLGPIAGAVFGIVQGIGGVIDATSSDVSGADPIGICESAIEKMAGIKSALEEEVTKVEFALDEILNYVDGRYIDQFLAPEINFSD